MLDFTFVYTMPRLVLLPPSQLPPELTEERLWDRMGCSVTWCRNYIVVVIGEGLSVVCPARNGRRNESEIWS